MSGIYENLEKFCEVNMKKSILNIIKKIEATDVFTTYEIRIIKKTFTTLKILAFAMLGLTIGFVTVTLSNRVDCQENTSEKTLSSPIMSINGNNISTEEYIKRLERVQVTINDKGEKQLAVNYVIGQLINEGLILQLAQKEGVMPTNEELVRRVARMKDNTPDFNSYLAKQGMSEDEWISYIEYQMAFNNLVVNNVKITDDDVLKAYDNALKQEPSPFITPPKVKISIIMTKKKENIEAAYKMLADGANFGSVAEMKSEDDSTKRRRGDAGWISQSDNDKLPQMLIDTAFSLAKGKYSKPIYVADKWIIIMADELQNMRVQSYDSVKDILKEKLTIEKGIKSGNFQSKLLNFISESKINVFSTRYRDIYNAEIRKIEKNKSM